MTDKGILPSPAQRLRQLLAAPGLTVVPGCFDGLSAKVLADAHYPAGFMSGFAVSAARLGLPDTGLISFAEMAGTLRDCCAAAPGLLIIGDGDTGYGNAINVQRTVCEYARAGAAAIMIEDQVSPKTCDHAAGKQVIGRAEARLKIRAAVEAARDVDILILARTDACGVLGFGEALARCHEFAAEGADIIYLDAPGSEDEMRRMCAELPCPCMANVMFGSGGPVLSAAQLEAIGFRLVTYPHLLLASGLAAMRQAAAALVAGHDGRRPLGLPMLRFDELKRALGFDEYFAQAARYGTPDGGPRREGS
jgi:2-methylisocitrate lyase-like PEP mutase family enzyme